MTDKYLALHDDGSVAFQELVLPDLSAYDVRLTNVESGLAANTAADALNAQADADLATKVSQDESEYAALAAKLSTDEAAWNQFQTTFQSYADSIKAEFATDEGRLATLESRPAGSGGTTVSQGEPIDVDSYFSYAADDTAKLVAINKWNASFSANAPRPCLRFAPRVYNINTDVAQVETRSGSGWLGSNSKPAREYGTGTVFNNIGSKPMMKYVVNSQGYPSDGSPRDMYFEGIQFSGKTSIDFIAPCKMDGSDLRGQTMWYVDFHNCGWVNWKSVFIGYGNGLTISGHTHYQGINGTGMFVGGSECSFYKDGQSYGTGPGTTDVNAAFFRSAVSKSYIGRIMTTTPGNGFGLEIVNGYMVEIDGFQVDAQDSVPMYGAGCVVNGGEGIVFKCLEVKGSMTNAAKAPVGRNRAAVQINAGSQIAFNILMVQHGTASTPTNVPDIWTGPNVGIGAVKVVVAVTARGGAGPILAQSVKGQIVSFDPTVIPILQP